MEVALEKHHKRLPSACGPKDAPTGWDFGDDIKDYEERERDAWNKFRHNNPIYMEYR